MGNRSYKNSFLSSFKDTDDTRQKHLHGNVGLVSAFIFEGEISENESQ